VTQPSSAGSVSERKIAFGTLFVSLALAAFVFGRGATRGALHLDAAGEQQSSLSLVPPGAAFVLTANVKEIRSSPIASALLSRVSRVGGDLNRICGFDPLSHATEVALSAVAGSDVANAAPQDFAIIAAGDFSAADFERCAVLVIQARGGDPVSSRLGSFHSVRDRKVEGGEIAVRDGGPLIVSGGSYFRAVLDEAEGHGARRPEHDPRDTAHAALRRTLGPGQVLATWLLPEHWVQQLTGEDNERLSPLQGLKVIGARLDLTREARLNALLECVDAEHAKQIAGLFDELRGSLLTLEDSPAVTTALSHVQLVNEGARLRLSVSLTGPELDALLLELGGPPDQVTVVGAPSAAPPAPPSP